MTAPTRLPRLAALLLLAGSNATAVAQTYDVWMNADGSQSRLELTASAPLVGTFIGDYDPASNPGGTRTLPGIFGGSGNQPIAFDAVLGGRLEVDEVPTGGMQMVMTEGSIFLMRSMWLDLLGGGEGALVADIAALFPTFRTFSPNSLFVGGFPIAFPLEVGQITAFSFEQTAMTAGVLVPQGKGVFSFFALVPGRLLVSVELQGRAWGGEPIDILLPMFGEMAWDGESMEMSTLIFDEGANTWDLPIDPLASEPFDLPTILPPGQTAHLLVTGEFGQVSTSRFLDLSISGLGEATCSFADLNDDCLVDGTDLGIVLGSWGGRGPADLNDDGVVGSIDLALVLASWQP